ncbi:hypothetical protein CIB48_g5097 [Xylaria polymorpha]|nr:hypothetical protein CIB48_g5097 [Xylaria polymorpha]
MRRTQRRPAQITTPSTDSPAGDGYQDMTSTAPTTPGGRSSSGPSHDEQYADTSDSLQPPPSSSSHSTDGITLETHHRVGKICCIGAGYVVLDDRGSHRRSDGVPEPAYPRHRRRQRRARIARWNSRHLPIYEPGLRHIVRIARDGGRAFTFANAAGSSDEAAKCIVDADLVFIAVNTPTKSTGVGAGAATDVTAFEAAAVEIAKHAHAGTIIVEKSTVPCRMAETVQKIMATHRPEAHFEILSNPEFLAAGTAVQNLLYPDRVLIGSSATDSGRHTAGALADVYAAWVPRTRIITTNVWSSELSKLVSNAMLAQRISSINSISAICEATGAEIDEAGIGFRGSCFKKDVLSLVYLADSFALHQVGEYWRQVISMNEYQRDRFSKRVVQCLNSTLAGKKITFLGFAFKANTSDMRESPTLDIIKTLLDEKPGEIAIFDPCCNPAVVQREIEMAFLNHISPIVVYPNIYKACDASNAVLITTECDEFRNTRPQVMPLPGCKSGGDIDPRPFAQRKPTEMEILALHEFLVRASPLSRGDPLQRYREEPSCLENCTECELVKTGQGNAGGYRTEEIVDWQKIAYNMKKPKWLFDGKGIIDPKKMAALGIHVESIGRQGRH